MPKAASWRNSPLGNVVILAVTTVVVLAVVWIVGFAKSDGPAQPGVSAGAGGQVSEVDVPDSGQPAPKVGEPAPQFTAETLDGELFDLADPGGKATWLIFNATWCSNCRAEIPDIQEAFDKGPQDLRILSIYVSDSPGAVESYSEKLALTFPQTIDSDNRIAALYRVMGLPTHYFIDAEGDVAEIRVGTLSPAQIHESLTNVGVAAS